jgi:2-(1,2-epoxy-1,2-dihydrophenyl)acetyl-CoA isomerase
MQVLLETDGSIVTITLHRPEKLNAIGPAMRDELLDALDSVAANHDLRALVITGYGRGFSAGGDIEYLKQLRDAGDEQGFRAMLAKGPRITRLLRGLPIPVIAAVNGPCAGAGLCLALSCDIRIASDKAAFGPTFARIGLHPDWGGSWFLPRLVGPAKALELVFTGDMIPASEAERIGLVNRVTPHDELIPTVRDLASRMAKNPAGVLRLAKESIYKSLNTDLDGAFAREDQVQIECFRSADFLEGVTAFLEKRPAKFRGL